MPLQTQIIDTVNKVLSRNDTSFKLNEGGICGGIASLYVKYTLGGKKKEFFQLSKKLALLPENYQFGQDVILDKFITEIEMEFNRFNYTKGQSYQGDMGAVFIDGKPIKKEFSLGLVDSKANWATILEQIKNEGRACYVRSHNHAIAISFVNNQYEIYDPNYDEDNDDTPNAVATNTRHFETAAEAVEELSQQFGYPLDSDLGLGIIVYANPNETKLATYPDKSTLLENSLKIKTDYHREIGIKDPNWKYNSLFFATNINDRDTIQYHLQQNEISLLDCAYLMLMDSNNDIVYSIYINEPALSRKKTLIEYAIWSGNTELFSQMTSDYQKSYVSNDLQREEFKSLIQNNFSLLSAAQSRSPVCILQVLELYKNYGIPLSSISEATRIKIVIKLTKYGDGELLNTFIKEIPLVSDAVVLAGISSAIKHDKRGALSFWLEVREHQTKTVNSTLITNKVINKVSLLNFQQLIQSGFAVDLSLFPEALKRNRTEFFELSVTSNPASVWSEFIQKLKSHSLQEPIDLFTPQQGITALQVLISYKENELIKKNWPASAPENTGTEALKFACECGNKVMVEFLSRKGFKVPADFQINQLEQALEANDHPRLDAVLASSIDYVQFFTLANEKLIKNLTRIGKYEFIIKSWNTYKTQHQSTEPLSQNNLDLGKLLLIGITSNNKGLYEYISKEAPELTLKAIKVIIDSNNADFYPYAIKMAMALPGSTQTLASSPLYEFIQQEMSEYDQLLFERQTKDDLIADKKFRMEARKLIQPLCDILIYAIENHYFSFAKELGFQVSLSLNELYDLFIRANQTGNQKAIEFLLENSPGLTTNKEVYLRLAESKEFDLLALLLRQRKPVDHVYLTLLKAAVRAHHEPVIQLLSAYINSAYKIEGSPMYEAIEEGNKEGCILLLKYDADIPPSDLFSLAIKQNDDRLLHAAFQRPRFAEYFKKNEAILLDLLFSSGSPETIMYFYKYKMVYQENQQDYFDGFLNYAISSDDLPLFKQLQKETPFDALDKMELFKRACNSRAPTIVNELLQFPLTFPEKSELHPLLDILFDVDAQETQKDAHSIYDLIYKKALNRLYEFVIESKYRPFASLFRSIDELVDDPGLSGPQKNYLISRALMEGEQDILDALLLQAEKLPEVDQNSISLFEENLNKPMIIRVLLNHYKLEEVLTKALELEQWPTIATLLKGRSIDELDPSLIAELKRHDAALFKEIYTEAQKNLAVDPRHDLNQLLTIGNNLALSTILENQKTVIQDSIMSIQKLMEENKIDLKNTIYRFDLFNDLASAYNAMNELTPKMEQFYERNKESSLQIIIANESNRNELREFKKVMDAYNLVPAYFDSGDDLENAFQALKNFDKEDALLQQQKEQDALLQQQKEQDALLQQQKVQDALLQQQKEQDALLQLQKEQDALLQQQKEQDALLQQQKEQDALLKQQEEQKVLLQQQKEQKVLLHKQKEQDARLHTQKEQKAQLHQHKQKEQKVLHTKSDRETQKLDPKAHKPQAADKIKIAPKDTAKLNPLSGLINVIQDYVGQRKEENFTHFWIPLFQYTKTDKINAASHFISAINNPALMINDRDKAILNDGRLHKRIKQYLEENELAIQSHFNLSKPVTTVNQLINIINKQDPITKLIHQLEQYHQHRSKQPETYHLPIFTQYTGTEKRRAVSHLIAKLKGEDSDVSTKDLGALNQGSLGTLLSDFIKNNKTSLTQALNVNKIKNLDDLIAACDQNQKGISLNK
jgi:hypothetical protein